MSQIAYAFPAVTFLFNSKGEHIANEFGGLLYLPNGRNIGYYLNADDYPFFSDHDGEYLGEILDENRLLYNNKSPYQGSHFGEESPSENITSILAPGKIPAIELPTGYDDVDLSQV